MSLAIILGICSALAVQAPSLSGVQAMLASEVARQEAQTSGGGTAPSQAEEKKPEGTKSEKEEGAKDEPQAGSASQNKSSEETSKPDSSSSGKAEEASPGSQATTSESGSSSEPKAVQAEPGQKSEAAEKSQAGKKTKKKGQKQSAQKNPPEQEVTPGQETAPGKVVVRNGGASDPPDTLTPSMTEQQASTQIENTNSLLSTTDENLRKISGKQLDSNQQDMLKQARKYVEQAREAAETGDVVRAKNLALKAQLLSEELVKH